MRLLRCNNLHESDFYFETILAASLDIDLLGDIELRDEEFNHLTELISKELKKPGFFISDSLSIAVFLVWTGILHYKDNFWGPVYKFLELPTAQVKWQRHLGDIFIQTLKKHRLPYLYLEGKLRYIIPILTHGYIPNYYLDSFFNDVLVQLYIDRKNTGITDNLVNLDEIKHIVSNWQHEYKIHQVLQKQKAELESQEKDADIILEILKNKDYLIRLNELSDELIDSDVINKLLALPEDWLIDTEVKIKNLEEICTLLDDALETSIEINNRQNELRELNQKIGETASHIMDYWNETLIDYVLNIPSKSIEETVHEYNAAKRPFQGSLGWLLRLILRRRFKRIDLCKRELEQYLSNLPVRKNILEDPPLILSKKINIIQKLIKIRNRIEKELEVIRESEKELAALSQEKIFLDKILLSIKINYPV